jgi:hypothetical protein
MIDFQIRPAPVATRATKFRRPAGNPAWLPPTEVALFGLGVERRYLSVALPKLDIVTVDELLCQFNRRFIVGAVDLKCLHEVAVDAKT